MNNSAAQKEGLESDERDGEGDEGGRNFPEAEGGEQGGGHGEEESQHEQHHDRDEIHDREDRGDDDRDNDRPHGHYDDEDYDDDDEHLDHRGGQGPSPRKGGKAPGKKGGGTSTSPKSTKSKGAGSKGSSSPSSKSNKGQKNDNKKQLGKSSGNNKDSKEEGGKDKDTNREGGGGGSGGGGGKEGATDPANNNNNNAGAQTDDANANNNSNQSANNRVSLVAADLGPSFLDYVEARMARIGGRDSISRVLLLSGLAPGTSSNIVIKFHEDIFDAILQEEHVGTITGVLIVQAESVILLLEASLDTSTSFLRALHAAVTADEAALRQQKQLELHLQREQELQQQQRQQQKQQQKQQQQQGKLGNKQTDVQQPAPPQQQQQQQQQQLPQGRGPSCGMRNVRVLAASENCPSAYFDKWFHYSVRLQPGNGLQVDRDDSTDTAWEIMDKLGVLAKEMSSTGAISASDLKRTYNHLIPADETVSSICESDDFLSLAEYIELYDTPVNVRLDSELVWPAPHIINP